tara:strand:+ start:4930 stop:5082 length:153 start_codon:yes stop_codon:yes gene_type:complete
MFVVFQDIAPHLPYRNSLNIGLLWFPAFQFGEKGLTFQLQLFQRPFRNVR